MKSVHDHLLRADAAIWLTIGAVAIIVAAFTLVGSFDPEWGSFLAPTTGTALLAGGGWFYRSVRNEERLGAILTSTAQVIGFAAVAGPLSYIAATAGFPLQDATFNAWDRHLHFDWTQVMMFISARPGLQHVLFFAYSSFALQTITTVLVLGITGQLARLSTFVIAFVSTALITIAISAILPAAGPWLFLELQPAAANGFLPASASSWPAFLGLRDGTLRTVYGLHTEGIITFPSLHAAYCILFAAALYRAKGVKWIALGLNGLMLIATPAYGSHYFVDVIAGTAIAAVCWIVAARIIETNSQTSMERLAAIPSSPSIAPEALPQREAATVSQSLESV
jgi:membrane-associated phospholipid phosphatase